MVLFLNAFNSIDINSAVWYEIKYNKYLQIVQIDNQDVKSQYVTLMLYFWFLSTTNNQRRYLALLLGNGSIILIGMSSMFGKSTNL